MGCNNTNKSCLLVRTTQAQRFNLLWSCDDCACASGHYWQFVAMFRHIGHLLTTYHGLLVMGVFFENNQKQLLNSKSFSHFMYENNSCEMDSLVLTIAG